VAPSTIVTIIPAPSTLLATVTLPAVIVDKDSTTSSSAPPASPVHPSLTASSAVPSTANFVPSARLTTILPPQVVPTVPLTAHPASVTMSAPPAHKDTHSSKDKLQGSASPVYHLVRPA
jgi:hypothetical protein